MSSIGQCLIIGTNDQIFEAFTVGCGIGTGVPVLHVVGCFRVLHYLQYCCVLVEGWVFLEGKYAAGRGLGTKNYTLSSRQHKHDFQRKAPHFTNKPVKRLTHDLPRVSERG